MTSARRLLVALSLLALAAAVAACGSSSSDDGSGPIVVGFPTAQSGAFASYDKPAVDAAKLRIAEINAAGGLDGRKIKVVEADTMTKIDQTRVAADEVLGKGAKFLMITCDFDYGAPSVLEAQRKNVVAMSSCAGSTKFRPSTLAPVGFSMALATIAESASMAEWSYQERKARTAYVLVDPTIDVDKQSGASFTARWRQLGGTIVGQDSFQQDAQSFTAQIARLRALPKQPDAIFVASYPPGGVRALRALRAAGINATILADSNFDGSYWVKSVPGLSNMYHSAYASLEGDDPNPKVNKLVAQATKQSGKAPDTSLGLLTGYSAIEALEAAYAQAKSLDGAKLIKALETFRNKQLLVGDTTFDANSHVTLKRPIRIIGIQDGKSRYVATWTPQRVPDIK